MKYRHIKTGAVIDINSELIDMDWERVDVPGPVVVEETAPVKKTARGKKK